MAEIIENKINKAILGLIATVILLVIFLSRGGQWNVEGWHLIASALILVAYFWWKDKEQETTLGPDEEVIKQHIRPLKFKSGLILELYDDHGNPLWESEKISESERDFHFLMHGFVARVTAGVGITGMRVRDLDTVHKLRDQRDFLKEYNNKLRVKNEAENIIKREGIPVLKREDEE